MPYHDYHDCWIQQLVNQVNLNQPTWTWTMNNTPTGHVWSKQARKPEPIPDQPPMTVELDMAVREIPEEPIHCRMAMSAWMAKPEPLGNCVGAAPRNDLSPDSPYRADDLSGTWRVEWNSNPWAEGAWGQEVNTQAQINAEVQIRRREVQMVSNVETFERLLARYRERRRREVDPSNPPF